jgi:hypothetical protein
MGTVTSAGVFTPAGAGTATITATSTQDTTKSGSAPVEVATTTVLEITISGLPAGALANVTVTNPNNQQTTLTASGTINAIPGTYSITAGPVVVGTSTYHAAQATESVSVASGATSNVSVNYSIIIPNTTKVLDATGMNGLTVSPDGSTITLPASSSVAASLAVGDVLASGPATAAPNGLLVKILSVSTSGGTVTASVQQATLTDAVQQATFQFTESLGPANTTTSFRSKGKMSSRRALSRQMAGRNLAEASSIGAACAGNTNTFQLPFNVPLASGGGASLTLSGEEDFCPALTFSLQISGFQLVSMNATLTAGSDTSIGLAGSLQESISQTQNLGSIQASPTVVLIGDVPVVIQPALTPFVGISGSASASVYTGVTASSSLTAGVSYANGAWSPVDTNTAPIALSSPTSVDGQVSAKAFVGLKASVLLDGIVAPNISADGYLQFNSSLTGSPCWTLNDGLEADVGVDVTFLGESLANYTSPSLNLYSGSVLQATNTCFAPVLNSVTPNQVLLNSPDQTIALAGSNFVPDSTVGFNGQILTTTFIDPSDLTAVVPAGDLEQNGAFPITVNSPDSPGGTSSPVLFQVGSVTVTLSANSATVPTGASQLFTATVQGTSNTAVNWSVNGVAGGNATIGTITPQGVYTGPGAVPNPSVVSVTATSQDDPFDSASANVTVVSAGPSPYFEGYAFVSPDSTVCDLPAPWTPAVAPCLSAMQSGSSAFDLSVTVNGAASEVNFDGTNFTVTASTTTATTDNRADAIGALGNNYVLTSATLVAGTQVSMTTAIPRSGSLSAAQVQIGDTVTAQETFNINLNMNGVNANAGINPGVRVYSGASPQTDITLPDSSVFTFGLSGSIPTLLSQPNMVDTYASESSASATLGDLTVSFTAIVGLPFNLGPYDHVNTHGGDTGNASSTASISGLGFTLPAGVVATQF